MATDIHARSIWDRHIIKIAVRDAFIKLVPQHQIRNPVMFTVYVGAILTTVLFFQALLGYGEAPAIFILNITLWLWFTLLFANFAEAMAEGRGKAQAQALRKARREIQAKKLTKPNRDAKAKLVRSAELRA